jgi:hypothetical protein
LGGNLSATVTIKLVYPNNATVMPLLDVWSYFTTNGVCVDNACITSHPPGYWLLVIIIDLNLPPRVY